MELFETNETIYRTILHQSRLSESALVQDEFVVKIQQLKEFNATVSEPTLSVPEVYACSSVEFLRDSIPGDSFAQGDLKSLSHEFMDGYFRVPKVMD